MVARRAAAASTAAIRVGRGAARRRSREFGLPLAAFDNLLEARIFDLYDDPMPTLNDLEGYAGETASALIQLGAMILAGGQATRDGASWPATPASPSR